MFKISKTQKKVKVTEVNNDEPAPVPAARKKRYDVINKTGCQAGMSITLKNGIWKVTRLSLEHNHSLLPPTLSKLLRSHRYFTDQEKAIMRSLIDVNIPNRKILAFLSFLRGGMKNTNLVKTDISNFRTRVMRENRENDITQVVKFLKDKQVEDPLFFFTFDTGNDAKVKNIFWSYGSSSFDTTYETNRYSLKFAPFVGINGHGDNLLLAGALLSDETILTFRWLFSTFLTCMGGKHPKSIITDQDVAMRAAIALEFPNAVHRNCLHHIMSKVEILMGEALTKQPKFAMDLYDIVYNSLTEEEFERLWVYMLNKYKVHHLKYLRAMYENRKRFAPVYFKNNFFPFICSTSRSEGTNARFKENVGSTSSLISFVKEYDRIMSTMDEKGNLRDKNKAHDVAVLHSTYTFERQARDFYNTQIFYRFQQLVKQTGRYIAEEVEKDRVYMVYKYAEHTKHEVRLRKYLVLVDGSQENYVCICARFQKDGILCVHVLRTLIQMNKHTIPEKYFIDRWRPIDRKQVRDPTTFIPAELTGSNITLRYNLLGREFVNVAASGCLSLERTNYMMNELRGIHCELREMPVGQQNNDSDRATSEQQRNIANEEIHDIGGQVMDRVTQQTSIMVTTQELTHLGTQMTSIADVNPATVTLRNPDVVPKKGRPKGTTNPPTLD